LRSRPEPVNFIHHHDVIAFISQYAYAGIFTLLMFGIVGLPVPDEFLLTFVGYLVFRHRLELVPALLAAFGGSACGITLSFVLGRTAGAWALHHFGRWLRIDEADIQRVHNWFERSGGWSLTFGYYIAGVRHLTALVAGMADYEPPKFAAYAYSGALVWSVSFITLGYVLGERWHVASRAFRQTSIMGLGVVAVVLLGYLIWRQGWTKKER
jgi:membrane protein DedA with SNARE-associated domain